MALLARNDCERNCFSSCSRRRDGEETVARMSPCDIRVSRWSRISQGLMRATARRSEGDAVILVHRAAPRRIIPVPAIVVAVFGCALELLLGDTGDIAAEIDVVFQRLPWQWILIVADS